MERREYKLWSSQLYELMALSHLILMLSDQASFIFAMVKNHILTETKSIVRGGLPHGKVGMKVAIPPCNAKNHMASVGLRQGTGFRMYA
jgi:hypothetical protein